MTLSKIETRAESQRTVVLKLTSAVAIAGMIVRAGELIEVTKLEAADLVQRGRAVVAGSDDRDDFDDEAERIAAEAAEAERLEAERLTAEREQATSSDAGSTANTAESAQNSDSDADKTAEASQAAGGSRRNRAK